VLHLKETSPIAEQVSTTTPVYTLTARETSTISVFNASSNAEASGSSNGQSHFTVKCSFDKIIVHVLSYWYHAGS